MINFNEYEGIESSKEFYDYIKEHKAEWVLSYIVSANALNEKVRNIKCQKWLIYSVESEKSTYIYLCDKDTLKDIKTFKVKTEFVEKQVEIIYKDKKFMLICEFNKK